MTPLIKLAEVKYLHQHTLEITFSDGCIKQFDFDTLLDFLGMETALQDQDYFAQVQISPDQRSIAWKNGYDCCADWLRYFAKDIEDEWASVDETVGLRQRMKIATHRMLQKDTTRQH